MMIILYKKDKTKHKLLTCVSSTKSSSSVFMERMNKRKGVEGAQTQRVQSCGLVSCSPSPQTCLESGWPHTARGQRLEERSLCAFRLWCSNTCICIHTATLPSHAQLTRAHAHTHTLCQLEGGSDLALCARPTRKYCSSAACLARSRSCRGNTVCRRSSS